MLKIRISLENLQLYRNFMNTLNSKGIILKLIFWENLKEALNETKTIKKRKFRETKDV